jgi:hypothetical protein
MFFDYNCINQVAVIKMLNNESVSEEGAGKNRKGSLEGVIKIMYPLPLLNSYIDNITLQPNPLLLFFNLSDQKKKTRQDPWPCSSKYDGINGRQAVANKNTSYSPNVVCFIKKFLTLALRSRLALVWY